MSVAAKHRTIKTKTRGDEAPIDEIVNRAASAREKTASFRCLSERWRKLNKFAAKRCRRIDVRLMLHNRLFRDIALDSSNLPANVK